MQKVDTEFILDWLAKNNQMQMELAASAKISGSTLTQILKGHVPRKIAQQKIARVLKVKREVIFPSVQEAA